MNPSPERKRKHNVLTTMALLSTVAMILLAAAHPAAATLQANADGATFPAPLITTVIGHFNTTYSGYNINYQPTGSGQGITDFTSKSVDFAASDAPLNPAQISALPAPALHIPETIGSVTLSYNLPGIDTGMNLTGPVVAAIFNGTITYWDDAKIKNLQTNTTLIGALPHQPITTVHRSDGSGTTFVFTSWLCLESSDWAKNVGNGTLVTWPNGISGKGNSGVAAQVAANHYYIGYVELNYALVNHFTFADIRNPMGQYIAPSLASTQLAVNAASGTLPTGDQSWYNVRMLNENANGAYPIASFTYFLSYKELNIIPGMTAALANLVVSYLWYHVHTGQSYASALGYVQLPASVVTIDENSINEITYNGSPVSHTITSLPTLPGALPISILALALGVESIVIARRRNLTP